MEGTLFVIPTEITAKKSEQREQVKIHEGQNVCCLYAEAKEMLHK